MSFDAAFAHTVDLEGGYSDNPADKGGPTKFGITEAVARAHGYAGPMQAMPMMTAKSIYKQSYWDLIHLSDVDALSARIASEVFDTAVNCGQSQAVKFLQIALNTFLGGVAIDGLCGAQTIGALRAFLDARGSEGEKIMLAALNGQQGAYYIGIVRTNPADRRFVYGWFKNRVQIPAA